MKAGVYLQEVQLQPIEPLASSSVVLRTSGASRPRWLEAARLAARRMVGEGRGESQTPSWSHIKLEPKGYGEKAVTCFQEISKIQFTE